MKRLLFLFILTCSLVPNLRAQNDTYFPYPLIPDSIGNLQSRSDFLIIHFWDFCDLKKAFSSRAKMAGALKDYLSFMPYATADSVRMSIARFMGKLDKQPADQLFIANKAKEYLYGDSGRYQSDEIFIPFAKAVTTNRKIDKAERESFALLANVLDATLPGRPAPPFTYIDRDGNLREFAGTVPGDSLLEVTALYICDPTAPGADLMSTRLNANIRASQLIDQGALRVVCVTPGEATEEWSKAVASYPAHWTVGASADIQQTYDLRLLPSFYFIDERGVIQAKNIGTEQGLKILSNL